ncbi:class I SAM-dependent methyltransferase [Lentzea sp. NPDC006480]|uniref:class I SAM-dependent methyltransferase n=1 Tax=Lentzea sp. NPDC006480 TaxID=3157176 RepID=UPI0033BB3910
MTDLLSSGYRGPHALSNRGWLDFVARLERREEIALVRSLTSGNSRALDVGGGTGELTRAVAVQLGGCTAVEPDADRATRLRETGIEILPGSAEELPFDDGTFDVVLANWILPYVTDLERSVREIGRVVDLSHPEAKVVFIGGAPDNELVALLNETCVPIAGEPPDDQGYLLAVAEEVLGQQGFSRFDLYRTEAALHFPEAGLDERVRAAARTLVNFWYEDHPAAQKMLTAVEPALRRHFSRRPHAVGDQGVVLVARP